MADIDPLAKFDDKKLRFMIDEIKRGRNETALWKDMFDGVSTTLLGISGSVFFKQVPKSLKELAQDTEAANRALMATGVSAAKLQEAFISRKVVDSFGNVTNAVGTLRQAVTKTISDYSAINRDLDSILKKMSSTKYDDLSLDEQKIVMQFLNSQGLEFLDSITDINDKVKVLNQLTNETDENFIKQNKHRLKQLASHESINDLLKDDVKQYEKSRLEYEKLLVKSRERMREPSLVEMLKNGLEQWNKNFAKGVVKNLTEVDNSLHEIQRNTGVLIGEGVDGLAQWTMHLAKFGMNVKDAGQLIEGLGSQLGTTDVSMMMEATKKFAPLPKALGISSDEITTISSEMMRAGNSADDVYNALSEANVSAKMIGVNSRNVVKQISKNLDKMRQFGFEGGIKSLTLMAAKAEKMRIQVDEIFDVAKRARTIEGAMDMAAQLQLAGGSFSNINPMELLSAARKGPEELGKILTTMGGDIGHWSEDMKEYKFDPVDVDRLQIVADATGMSLDSLQKVIQKNAEVNKKTSMIPDSVFDGAIKGIDGMDSALAKSTLSDFMEWDAQSKTMKLTTDEKKLEKLRRAGITDISQMNEGTLQAFFKMNHDEQKTLEEQAKENMSLKESMDAFVASLTNVFTVIQPIMDSITKGLNYVSNTLGDAGKAVVASLLVGIPLAAAIFGKSIGSMLSDIGSTVIGRGRGKKDKKGKKGKKGPELGGNIPEVDGVEGATDLADKLTEASVKAEGISMKSLGKLALALTIVGGAVVGFMYLLNKVGGAPSLPVLAAAAGSLAILGGGVALMSKIKVDNKNLLEMAGAMAIVGAAMVPFAFAMNMMKDVEWTDVLASLGIMALSVLALMGLGYIMGMSGGVAMIALMAGAEALLVVGEILAIAGAGLLVAGMAFEKLASINWKGLDGMGAMLAGPQIILLGIGAAALIDVGVSLAIASAGLLVAGMTFEKLASINWKGLDGMGAALLQIVPGLLAFSAASMLFINPIAMLGMGLMMVQLLAFSSVLTPLSKSLETSQSSMLKFAIAMQVFKNSVKGVDIKGVFSSISDAVADLSDTLDDVDMDRVSKALSSIRLNIDTSSIDGLKSAITAIPAIVVHVDKAELDRVRTSLSSVRFSIDKDKLASEMSALPPIKVDVDQKGLMQSIGELPALTLTIDEKRIMETMSSMSALKVELDKESFDAAIAKLPSLSISIETSGAMKQLMEMSNIKLGVDTESLIQALSSIPALSIKVDQKGLVDSFASLPAITVRVDTSEVYAQLEGIPKITIGMELGDLQQMQSMVKEMPPIQIDIDLSQLKQAMEMLGNKEIFIDASGLYKQMEGLPPFEVVVQTSEIERMVALLSSLKVSLDVSDIQSVLSGFKIGVDTTKLEGSLSELQSLDTQSISASLSSIEATISKIGEERTAAVKGATDELNSSNNKLQTEVMMKLVEAIDRLGAMNKDKEQSAERRIVVELEMDGRQLKTKILKDTSLQA